MKSLIKSSFFGDFYRDYNLNKSFLEEAFVSLPKYGESSHFCGLEVHKNDDINGITLSVDVPGVKKEDVSIDYNDGFIIVKGTRKSKQEDRLYSSVSYSDFSVKRYVGDVSEDEINASLKDGILKIDIPLRDSKEKNKKKIKIK